MALAALNGWSFDMPDANREEMDDMLGMNRCARCGHRLDGLVECPFCAVVEPANSHAGSGKWVYFTACFLTSPLSIYSVITTGRLSLPEKVIAVSGCLVWSGLYRLLLW